ncbi:MAG: cupin domain-containing protein [Bryobacteraceae bacterium]|jgi:mannose-6-phosphate isomerase-like protein (cupin superfamily)
MRAIGIVMAAVLFTGWTFAGWTPAMWAQQPAAQAMKTFASSADVQNLIANAKKIRKTDQPMVSQPILQLAPYRVNLEYRPVVGPASIHEKEAELFYVIEGAGTLVTGGKLANERRTNAANLTGTAIEGGTPQGVSKGDFFFVPENTAHWFSEIKSAIVVMSLHVPRSEAK